MKERFYEYAISHGEGTLWVSGVTHEKFVQWIVDNAARLGADLIMESCSAQRVNEFVEIHDGAIEVPW